MSDITRNRFILPLSGYGLDIGPLHRPMVKHKGMQVRYVDRFPVEKLREHYPELAKFDLIEPDFLDDAETLSTFPDNTEDFVIASHVIEHMRNPIGAVENWLRVLKTGKHLYLVVPDYRKIFDKHRKRTTLQHMIEDYTDPSPFRDRDHYWEYAEKVNCEFFGRPLDVEEETIRLFYTDYSIHFHTFTPDSMFALLQYVSGYLQPIEIVDSVAHDDEEEFHFLVEKLGA